MKITNITVQARNADRVNISVDGKYRFSLDIFQVGELGVKVGKDYSEDELVELETESQFGKLYARALEYTMLRPHSAKEIRDYLWRKTRTTKMRSKKTGEMIEREGVNQSVADRVYARLVERGHVDDYKFTRFWVENRNQTKGASSRKLTAELRSKGVDQQIIHDALNQSSRSDNDEIKKVLLKKRSKYPDEQKLIQYLARQGFNFDDIRAAIDADE